MHQLAAESAPDMTVFLGEGTVLIAYLLFVYSEGAYSQSDLERFSALVPKPYLPVHVGAPVGVLVQRAKDRSDTRRELAGLDARVANQEDSAGEIQGVAAEVASAIQRLDSSGRRPTPKKDS